MRGSPFELGGEEGRNQGAFLHGIGTQHLRPRPSCGAPRVGRRRFKLS